MRSRHASWPEAGCLVLVGYHSQWDADSVNDEHWDGYTVGPEPVDTLVRQLDIRKLRDDL